MPDLSSRTTDSFSHIGTPFPTRRYAAAANDARFAIILTLLFGGALLSLGATRVWSQESSQPGIVASENVKELVLRLGSQRFSERELASEQLFQMGPRILAELRYSRPSAIGQERQMRLDFLIDALAEDDRENRIKQFLEGDDSQLKNWSELKKWFGDSRRVREMFVELYREYPSMIEALGGTPQEISFAALAVRNELILNTRGGPRRAIRRTDSVAMLLPLTDPNCRLAGELDQDVVTLLSMPIARDFQRDPALGESYRSLVSFWMKDCSLPSRELALRLTLMWDLPVGKQIAAKTLDENPPPDLLARCLQTLARKGGKEQISVMERFLDDQRIAKRRSFIGQRYNDVLVSDVASAMIALSFRGPGCGSWISASGGTRIIWRGI